MPHVFFLLDSRLIPDGQPKSGNLYLESQQVFFEFVASWLNWFESVLVQLIETTLSNQLSTPPLFSKYFDGLLIGWIRNINPKNLGQSPSGMRGL